MILVEVLVAWNSYSLSTPDFKEDLNPNYKKVIFSRVTFSQNYQFQTNEFVMKPCEWGDYLIFLLILRDIV